MTDRSVTALAARICSYLRDNGVDTVLSGGSCVTIYSESRYVSLDLDFVLMQGKGPKSVTELMENLGFKSKGRIFVHPEIEYSVEFMRPPLAIGEEKIERVNEITEGPYTLKLLMPTDCAKDRLAAYFYWNDMQSLDQAVLVAQKQNIDLEEIRRWAASENHLDKYEDFLNRLSGCL
ncbi:MAG: hypothetical protein PHT33_02460 [bacterium]|nr:hypothetical protein [bacterium]